MPYVFLATPLNNSHETATFIYSRFPNALKTTSPGFLIFYERHMNA